MNKVETGLSFAAIVTRALAAGVSASDIEAAKATFGIPGVKLADIETNLMARAAASKSARSNGKEKPTEFGVVSLDKGKTFLFSMSGNFWPPFSAGKKKVQLALREVEKGNPEATQMLLGDGLKYTEFVRGAQSGEVAKVLAAHPELK